jgi:hypothetical protein
MCSVGDKDYYGFTIDYDLFLWLYSSRTNLAASSYEVSEPFFDSW